jgi:23S rRNA pseudouridine2605 synthase
MCTSSGQPPSPFGLRRPRGLGTGDVQVRLQKILAGAGVASRRAAEKLMTDGRVSVNGSVVRELGTRADPDVDHIVVDGRPIHPVTRFRYLLLNKPRGYVTTRSDPQGRPTVLDLLEGVRDYVYPVGRLDYDSEGLLILTNDGDLAARLMHPRYQVEREYHARVRGTPDVKTVSRIAQGVMIGGGRTAPADVRMIAAGRGQQEDQAVLAITVHEGRQRQVRNMCEAVGHPVVRLRRVRIGPISDSTLKTGTFRELTSAEVARLRRAAGIDVPTSVSRPRIPTQPGLRRGHTRPRSKS